METVRRNPAVAAPPIGGGGRVGGVTAPGASTAAADEARGCRPLAAARIVKTRGVADTRGVPAWHLAFAATARGARRRDVPHRAAAVAVGDASSPRGGAYGGWPPRQGGWVARRAWQRQRARAVWGTAEAPGGDEQGGSCGGEEGAGGWHNAETRAWRGRLLGVRREAGGRGRAAMDCSGGGCGGRKREGRFVSPRLWYSLEMPVSRGEGGTRGWHRRLWRGCTSGCR